MSAPLYTTRHRIADLEAETARLQARVMELGRGVAELLVERDGYKAQSERRGEALRKALPGLRHYGRPHEQGNLDCPRCPADAALAARID